MLSQGCAPPREGSSQVQPCPCPAPGLLAVPGTPGCWRPQGVRVPVAQGSPSLPPAGALVLLSLAYLTSLFYYIPKAALAAVIISAVVPMFDAGIFLTLWRVKSEGFSRERAIPLLRKLPSHPTATPAATLSPPELG